MYGVVQMYRACTDILGCTDVWGIHIYGGCTGCVQMYKGIWTYGGVLGVYRCMEGYKKYRECTDVGGMYRCMDGVQMFGGIYKYVGECTNVWGHKDIWEDYQGVYRCMEVCTDIWGSV